MPRTPLLLFRLLFHQSAVYIIDKPPLRAPAQPLPMYVVAVVAHKTALLHVVCALPLNFPPPPRLVHAERTFIAYYRLKMPFRDNEKDDYCPRILIHSHNTRPRTPPPQKKKNNNNKIKKKNTTRGSYNSADRERQHWESCGFVRVVSLDFLDVLLRDDKSPGASPAFRVEVCDCRRRARHFLLWLAAP